MPYDRATCNRKVIQAWVSKDLAVLIDLESVKRATELGISLRSAKASLVREALIRYLKARGVEC